MKIVDKPWGREIWWAHAEGKYMGKILKINSGQRLSLQFHVDKDETIYVTKGNLKLYYAEQRDGQLKQATLQPGESFRVRPGTLHRFSAEFGDVELLEVSTDYPEDVVRVEDDYSRTED